jgi:hypothetical protein
MVRRPPRPSRRGFALPLVIMIIAVMAVLLTAGVASTSSEMLATQAQDGQTRALAVAQSGLQEFLARRSDPAWCVVPTECSDNPAGGTGDLVESKQFAVRDPDGNTIGGAFVQARRVRPATPTESPVFLITSRGVDSTGSRLSRRRFGGPAERVVSVYARWSSNTIKVSAAWTSLNGIDTQGNAADVTAKDSLCTDAPTEVTGIDPVLSSAGLTFSPTRKPTSLSKLGVFKGGVGGSGGLVGYAGGMGLFPDSTSTATIKSFLRLDWPTIIDQNGLGARIVHDAAEWAAVQQGFGNPSYWPIIIIDRPAGELFPITSAGRGILISRNDLKLDAPWDGIILVGGRAWLDEKAYLVGTAFSGLNVLTGNPSPDLDVIKGSARARYGACNVKKATRQLVRYVPMSNAWSDNLPAY